MHATQRYHRVTVVTVLAVIVGCSTTPRSVPRYAWESAQEDEYTSTFRGRWWNYYDRGLWNQLRGDYAAAVADLQAARYLRADDQLWPRTYGLHFLPEYFPNRELGITYYHMNRNQESAALLEKSLDQQYSARASYYLDLARTENIEAHGLDKEPPSFRLLEPSPEGLTGDVYAEMRGEAHDDTFVKEIFVNGEPVDVPVSQPVVTFRHPITLGPGTNHVKVRIVDLSGKSTTTDVALNADHDGPVVSFGEYEAATAFLEGLVYDPAGVQSLVIGGEPIRLEERADRTFAFRAEVLPSADTTGVSYRCEDSLGNVTEGFLEPGPDQVTTRGGPVERTRLAMSTVTEGESPARQLARLGATDPEFRVALVNLDNEQRFYQPTITVDIHVNSPAPVKSVEFNGENIAIIPAQRVFSVSRTLGLGTEPNEIHCTVVATNADDEQSSDEKTIYRDLSPVETEYNKLSFAVFKVDNSHPLLSDDDAEEFINDVRDEPEFHNRFGGIVVRDEETIQAMLLEHTLSELSSEERKLLPEEVQTADVLLTAKVRGDENFIEVVLEGKSTTVNRIITNRVEVAGGFSDYELENHKRALAIRLAQEFPRLQAPVVDVRPNGVYFPLYREDGIRPYYSCLFVKNESVGEGRFKQNQLNIVRQGLIENAEKQPRYSRARFDFPKDFVENLVIDPTSETYFVVTK